MSTNSRKITLSSSVYENDAGKRLIEFLCLRFPYKNQQGWEQSIEQAKVMVNQNPATADQVLQLRDRISYVSQRVEPEVATLIETLYEDDSLLIVNKPAPLPIHADGRFIMNTLIYLLREKTGNPELRLAHRLDRETSGIVVLGKNKDVTKSMMLLFENGLVEKYYLAVVHGNVAFSKKRIQGWMLPKRGSLVRIRQELCPEQLPGSKFSSSEIQFCKLVGEKSLVQCQPLSGRTNQLRVHLESIGHPIVGDKLYGRPDQDFLSYLDHLQTTGRLNDHSENPRHLLHAWKISFLHPILNTPLNIEAPIPADFSDYRI